MVIRWAAIGDKKHFALSPSRLLEFWRILCESFSRLYIKVKGQWRYLYRAVDKQGQTVDFLLSENRDQAAAVRFFKKAIGNHEALEKITLDGSRASHQAVAELKAEGVLPALTLVRTSKYLNNMIEQDHRKVKQRCYPMLGFKIFGNAEVTLSGIELANKIKKGQCLPRKEKLKQAQSAFPRKFAPEPLVRLRPAATQSRRLRQ
jgi:transposase-like protein